MAARFGTFIRNQAVYVLLACSILSAQQGPSQPLTIEKAVAAALERYPSMRASEAGVREAAAAIQLARTAYLPQLNLIGGVNRATRNNVLGLLLPSQIFAPVTGPVLGTNNLSSAWGSTAGVLVTWEPFDFGLRRANVAVAEAGRVRAEAAVTRTRLDLATLVADTFLTLVAAEQTVTAAQAAVDRARELQTITDALVRAELRPGAESSLARAEQAAAEAQLIRARQSVAQARAALAAFLAIDAQSISVSADKLLRAPGPLADPEPVSGNPAARQAQAAVQESEARLQSVNRMYFPRFSLQGTSYARGTGALPDGRLLGGANGLGPNIQNWGVGFTVDFSVFDIAAIKARKSAEDARLQAERAGQEQVLIDLKSRRDQAIAAYDGALRIAETTPIAVEAACAATTQAKARYQSGLGTALEVADAQRRVAQAEIDDSLARLSIWRARLAIFAAVGDIAPMLTEASR